MAEEKIYTTEELPGFSEVEYYCQFVEDRPLSPVRHRHTFYEMLWMISGETCQQINDDRLTLHGGELVFLSPREYHCFLDQSDHIILLGLSVTEARFRQVCAAFGFEPRYGEKYTFESAQFSKNLLFQMFVKPEKQKLLLNALLCEMFLSAAQNLSGFREKAPESGSLEEALSLLPRTENLCQGVSFLTACTGYSRSQLYRLTQKYYQKTPLDLVTEIRMKLAAEYLRNTGDSLELISEKIGYHSVGQFHQVFRRYYGQSPGAFRRRNQYHLR